MVYTVVITGANRGLGLELATQLSKRPNTLVIGTARNPSNATALSSLPNTKVVALEAGDYTSVAAAAAEISKISPAGIDELWNNSAKNDVHSIPSQVPADNLLEELRINVVGPIVATQAFLPLLKAKKNGAKKVWFMSSGMGSSSWVASTGLVDMEQGIKFSKALSYTTSKAALTMVAVNFWGELKNQGFTVSPIHPGWVKTDMGGEHAAITKEESIAGMLKVTGELKQTDPVKLRDYAGNVLED